MRTKVKICGITNLADAAAAIEHGADAIGLVFAESPRRVELREARAILARKPELIWGVGVFMDQPAADVLAIAAQLRFDALQFHGRESAADCHALIGRLDYRPRLIKRFYVGDGDTAATLRQQMQGYDASVYLLDPGAGSGRSFRWEVARGIDLPLMVSGGLTPENVTEAIHVARPQWVDVSSGVEREMGLKDVEKMKAFIRAARGAGDDE